MPKEHRLKTRKHSLPIAPRLNFLLGCSQQALEQYELARLAELADLRKEWQALHGRIIELEGLVMLARWFREQDRQSLRHAIENEETPEEWAFRMIRDGQRSEDELFLPPSLPPGAAHLAAAVRYSERNVAEGKCSVCPEPLDGNSVRYCTKHLTAARTKSARQRGVKGEPGSADYLYGEISESTLGRTPGTLASLAINRERKTRALLTDLGIQPEHAAVSLNAAVEALQKCMPRSKAEAMTQAELRQAATVPSKQTCVRALAKLAGQVQRIGKGISGNPFRYFTKG